MLDDDIVEALHKPEMRSFLLRFERNMLLALVNPNVERVKFTTPFKSYQRRLVHRLADYYGYEREVTGRSAEEKSLTPSGVEQKAYLTLLKTKQTQMSKPNLLEICQSQKLELPEKFANGYQFSTTLQLPKKDIKAGTLLRNESGFFLFRLFVLLLIIMPAAGATVRSYFAIRTSNITTYFHSL